MSQTVGLFVIFQMKIHQEQAGGMAAFDNYAPWRPKRSRRCIDGDVNRSRLPLGEHITQVILNALAQRVLTPHTPGPISMRAASTHTARHRER